MRVGPRKKIVSRAKVRSFGHLGTAHYLVSRGLARRVPADPTASLGTAAFHLARGTARQPAPPPRNPVSAGGLGTATFLVGRGLARRPVPPPVARGIRASARAFGGEQEAVVHDPCGDAEVAPRASGTAEALLRMGRARSPAADVPAVRATVRATTATERRGPGVRRARDFADDGIMPAEGGFGDPDLSPDGVGAGVRGRFSPPGLIEHYDAHAHIICPSLTEWGDIKAHKIVADTRLPLRIANLQTFAASRGFEKMVISGWPEDIYDPDAMTDADDVNDVTWYVYQQDRTYFVPFATLMADDLTGGDPVGKLIATFGRHKYRGIGEIYVHSETISLTSAADDVLFELCKFAAAEAVPIQFHWSIGHADNADPVGSEQDNRDQLTRLLDRIVAELPTPPTVILAHCGIGPGTFGEDATTEYYDAWSDYLEDILGNPDYDFVMFDLAGMQSTNNPQLLTPDKTLTLAGEFILDMIDPAKGNHADRFMYATDAQKLDDGDLETEDPMTLKSLGGYEVFLNAGAATDTERAEVRHDNASTKI